MRIWVDADACPVVVREILFRAAVRTRTLTVFVANQSVSIPRSEFLQFIQVAQGFDIADNYIAAQVVADELVITSDIPLAAEVIEKQAVALSPRGELFTPENIKSRLNMRDFLDTLRASGIQSGGPSAYGQKERQQFANQLDRYLSKFSRSE